MKTKLLHYEEIERSELKPRIEAAVEVRAVID